MVRVVPYGSRDELYLSGVHLVDGNDELTHTESERQEGVLTGLTILRDTGLKFTNSSSDDKNSTIGLRSSRDHVFDEITMPRSVDNL